MGSMMTTDPCVFSLPPPICSIGETDAFLDLILTVEESLMYRVFQKELYKFESL
jgi:hypothetical protein